MQSTRILKAIYLSALLAALLPAWPVRAQNDICVPTVGGLAGLPTLDGTVSGDPGWNNALQLNLSGDLGATTATKVLVGTDGSNLWLGLIVSAIADDANTTFVLAFSANDGNQANDWRLQINPFGAALPVLGQPGTPGYGGVSPATVTYWRNSTPGTGWDSPSAAGTVVPPNGSWQDSNSNIMVGNIQGNASVITHWELEFKIPLVSASSSNAGFCLTCGTPSPSTFKLYMNVLDTASGFVAPPVSPAVAQDVWPPCNAGTICPSIYNPPTPTPISQLTPPTGNWGTGSLTQRPACTGVRLTAYGSPLQIGVVPTGSSITPLTPTGAPQTPLTQNIQANLSAVQETTVAQCTALADNFAPSGFSSPSNTFVAIPSNTMSNPAQVSVAFRLADFGIPGIDPSLGGSGLFPPLGSPVPSGCTLGTVTPCAGVTNNPTAQAKIDAFGADNPGQPSYAAFTSAWQLNYKQTCLFKNAFIYAGNPHQCVQAVMDSTDPNTVLLNHSVEENLNFVPASTFRQDAVISGSQGNVPSPTRFLLQLDTDEDGAIGVPPPPPRDNGNGQSNGVAGRVMARSSGAQIPRFREQALADIARQQIGSSITNIYQWIARGYVYTATKLIIKGQQYQWTKRAGDFGYVAGHTGEISGWDNKFEGADLKEVNPYLYTAVVAPGKTTTVTTTIAAAPLGTAIWLFWWILLLVVLLALLLIGLIRRAEHA